MVDVLAKDLTTIASIQLPYSLLPFSYELYAYVLDVDETPETELYDVNGTAVWGNASYSANLAGAIFSIRFPGKSFFLLPLCIFLIF